jgi:L-rhamnose mutarotase
MKETCKMVVKIAIENYRCFLSQEPYLLSDVTTSKAKKNTATISYPSIVKHGWEISEPAVKEALLAGKIIEVSCG